MADTTQTKATSTDSTPTPKDVADNKQIDWKAESRKWEDRAKENKANADAYATLKAKFDTLSKSHDDDATKLAEAQKTISDMEAQAKLNALREKVSRDTGVPVELLTGKDEDSLTKQAKGIADYAKQQSQPKLPHIIGDGDIPHGKAGNGWQQVAQWIAHNH